MVLSSFLSPRRALVAPIALALLALLCCGSPARATVVFNNGAPNQVGGNEMTHWVQAENFSLAAPATVTDVRFWNLQTTPADYQGSISWAIYADAAGTPGASPLFSGNTAAVTHTATGLTVSGVYSEFINDFSIGSISLGTGSFWLALHNGPLTTTTATNFYWESTSPGTAPAGREDVAPFGDGFATNGAEHAFVLFDNSAVTNGGGAVPLPRAAWPALATLMLLAASFIRRGSIA